MKKIFSNMALCFGLLLFLSFAAKSAYADGIVFAGPDPCFPAGVGRGCGPDRAPHILSLQMHGTEAGGVKYTSSGDVTFGNATRGSNTQTQTLSQLGVTNASSLRIYFDIIEPNGGNKSSVTLNSLILTAYDDKGKAVFSASLVGGPLTLQQIGNGQGHSDYAFGLDSDAAARLAAVFNPNLHIGLEANISSADGGPESFFIGARPAAPNPPPPAAVPEPTTMLLLGTGLAGVAARVRRRRKNNSE